MECEIEVYIRTGSMIPIFVFPEIDMLAKCLQWCLRRYKRCSNAEDKILTLLRNKKVNPGYFSNIFIGMMCRIGYDRVVENILKDERVDPTVNDCYPLYIAILGYKHGLSEPQTNWHPEKYLRIIKLLLEDGRAKLCYNDGVVSVGHDPRWGVCLGSSKKHNKIIEMIKK